MSVRVLETKSHRIYIFGASPNPRGNVEITTSLVLSSMHLCDFASVTQPPTLLQPRPRRLLLGRSGLASS